MDESNSSSSLTLREFDFNIYKALFKKYQKTNNDFKGMGTLIGPEGGQYYKTWAKYYLKFFEAYKKHNLTFWALTAQNEPSDGFLYRSD
jgi:hypothetical protein